MALSRSPPFEDDIDFRGGQFRAPDKARMVAELVSWGPFFQVLQLERAWANSPYRRWQQGRASHPHHLITDEWQGQLTLQSAVSSEGWWQTCTASDTQCSLVVIRAMDTDPPLWIHRLKHGPDGRDAHLGYFSPPLSLQFLFLSHLSW